jgi:hypothetical protein
MIIASITGGLGNQLFQYAMGRRLAAYHNTELLLDTSGYGPKGELRPDALQTFARPLALFRFNVKARLASAEEIRLLKDDFTTTSTRDRLVRQVRHLVPGFLWKSSHVIEYQFRFQPESLSLPDNVYLQGFWQSEKYFADIAAIIRSEIQIKDCSITESAARHINELRSRYGTVVSLHVRRGDLAHAQEVLKQRQLTHAAPVTTDYISSAMRLFPRDVCFMVFSDSPQDIKWCKEQINAPNLAFSTAESDLWDFTAMTYCDHHIIANSSFSWWASWLDDRPSSRVIAPKDWALPNHRRPITTDDLIPSRWELL